MTASLSLPVPPEPNSEARPVDASERLQLMDVLRGFALAGVLIANAAVFFSGWGFHPPEVAKALSAPPLDVAAVYFWSMFVSGKAVSIFSFLFGLGFSVQLARAEQRGASIVPLYSRRLLILIGIGMVHTIALWYGDILRFYALFGFMLLALRNTADRKLLITAGLLLVAAPALTELAIQLHEKFVMTPADVEAARTAARELRARCYAIFTGHSYPDLVWANARYTLEFLRPGRSASFYCEVAGKFMVGLLVGRHRLLHDVGAHKALFQRLLRWGLLAGVLCVGGGTVLRLFTEWKLLELKGWGFSVMFTTLREWGAVGMATFYVSGIALLSLRPRAWRVLGVLAPVGRMALTNYLMQSVCGVLIYDGLGFGVMGKVGPAGALGISVSLFIAQVIWSHLWLARFRFGPAEWLWRSLTYGKAQPMRLASPERPVATA